MLDDSSEMKAKIQNEEKQQWIIASIENDRRLSILLARALSMERSLMSWRESLVSEQRAKEKGDQQNSEKREEAKKGLLANWFGSAPIYKMSCVDDYGKYARVSHTTPSHKLSLLDE
ncbi:hypothetical protein KIN20_003548 [Parelaphostrongylus tenuis]|uniref:Uncharacterized protein n=1 Tax=Parelaphostrongylus tenuis TaxID=148309 RepID=A0AAD5QDT4_PARTN|nr:hypothetical protein KIN20_003548 [Parelaphostrongylus tenuis]